jgi:two-component system chemotaxis response regulator CheB
MSSIRVLIVDASPVIRQTLTAILTSDPDIEVTGAAADPYIAARRIQKEVPDVIILGVDLPRMDGITFLQKLMAQRPLPVVMCSSMADEGSQTLIDALDAGAVDVILKPEVGSREFLMESQVRVCDVVKAAAVARIRRSPRSAQTHQPKLTADAILPPPTQWTSAKTTEKVVLIGASTGGTESLRVVLETLRVDSPGMVIVQHMPEPFTANFARRLDSLCDVKVKEAQNGDAVMAGQALIAPGNKHLLLQRTGSRYVVEVKDGPLVSRHRPSVDVLFRSAARSAGGNAVGVIMTGMGDDGAQGLLEMRQNGAYTIAEDESTCVVFGMPKEAIARGGAMAVVPLGRIAGEIMRLCR